MLQPHPGKEAVVPHPPQKGVFEERSSCWRPFFQNQTNLLKPAGRTHHSAVALAECLPCQLTFSALWFGLGAVFTVDTWQLYMAIFAVSQGLVEELRVVQKSAVFYKTTWGSVSKQGNRSPVFTLPHQQSAHCARRAQDQHTGSNARPSLQQ